MNKGEARQALCGIFGLVTGASCIVALMGYDGRVAEGLGIYSAGVAVLAGAMFATAMDKNEDFMVGMGGVVIGSLLTIVGMPFSGMMEKLQPHACRDAEIIKMDDGQTATVKAPAGCKIKLIP